MEGQEEKDESQELGKIEKLPVEDFGEGRKLYFAPLVFCGKEAPIEYVVKYDAYWQQVEEQVGSLELKLGEVKKIFHELVPVGGDEGVKIIKELNDKSCEVVKKRLDNDAQLEVIEDNDLLTEIMDWSRCLVTGLQNPKVVEKVYQSYTEVSNRRNEYIARKIGETLKPEEIGLLFMREGHQVQFPSDIQVFYVAPPALDDIKRWLRDREQKAKEGEQQD